MALALCPGRIFTIHVQRIFTSQDDEALFEVRARALL
jgi:hypothetical protein